MTDERRLARALELAERGRGTTAPNPLVGAVIVRGGEVVGEGWHERAGGPHAEAVALKQAGAGARGATLYVTLEPCAHHGRTPPCADALVEAGIARVVAAVGDPNPLTNGSGFERLRAAGIEVELPGGEAERRARVQNEAYRVWVAEGRPLVVYKAAVTLDGRVTVPGARWVTGEASRRRVHELRAEMDAVAVGMGTVRADSPELTARDVGAARQPRRLAFGRGPLPEGSGLELLSGSLGEELARLGEEGVQSLLLEGGPTLATAFVRAGLVDKLLLFVAPTLSGAGPRYLGELPEPLRLLEVRGERVGDDHLVTAYLRDLP
ncbi:MAG TPA: bifunctional diaminohydroxyphosphoribosylaminopyrimidine deaminase/5-amino-6-(5-phosphoribosylamino)uracil reductase RibD [Gaiellaceae bacterium]|nr:bifunctional diaminohydroxyphosphoribosylaminopyrimidine deaminase/5-amino-6-(5-phosphoribosylamino)uracil reductase RibD [Gaiellaceae bacterium]